MLANGMPRAAQPATDHIQLPITMAPTSRRFRWRRASSRLTKLDYETRPSRSSSTRWSTLRRLRRKFGSSKSESPTEAPQLPPLMSFSRAAGWRRAHPSAEPRLCLFATPSLLQAALMISTLTMPMLTSPHPLLPAACAPTKLDLPSIRLLCPFSSLPRPTKSSRPGRTRDWVFGQEEIVSYLASTNLLHDPAAGTGATYTDAEGARYD